MLDTLFTDFSAASSAGSITAAGFLISIGAALVLGLLLTGVYTYRSTYTKSFVVTLALLPAIVSAIIMMVSGSLGASVAVAGTFSLVRFRSAPGTAREICAIFLAMAVGLACGMGCPGFAALFAIIMGGVSLLYTRLGFGEKKHAALRKRLQITVPEDLDYTGAFDDLFARYTSEATLMKVKTTNLGSLNRLTYAITFRESGAEKRLIDDLRCRNGNLEICCSMQNEDNREL
ncbi:MAG: DUF4956 domain-containing protein [Oscillibacter sp.]|nr:DUF4956 domain-containing protein [Oscillibacter sp.]